MDIPKQTQNDHFKAIFGNQLVEVQRVVFDESLGQKQKTQKITELFSKNLWNEMSKSGYKEYKLFVLPFSFAADDKEKISHHIIFITKSHKAVTEMKRVMIKHSTTKEIELSFDSKMQFQVSLFDPEEFIDKTITDVLIGYFFSNKEMFKKEWNIDDLLQYLDEWNMRTTYRVTRYSRDELKKVIEMLDKKNVIAVNNIPKGSKKRITYTRFFKIKEELLVLHDAK